MSQSRNIADSAHRVRTSASGYLIAACGLLIAAMSAHAQPLGNDYYRAQSTQETAVLLVNVEKYHIGPGMEKMQQGGYNHARDDFEFVLKYFPNHPRGLALISELCDVRWRNPRCDSETWFKKAIELNPSASQTFLVNGVHLHRLKRLPEAVESYKRAVALDPRSGNAHYNLGLIYVEQKEYESANRHAQIAYALGMPFPALRDKLTKAGEWKPLDAEQLQRATATDGAKNGETSK